MIIIPTALQIKRATRSLAKLKIAVSGASGSGKTLSSLLLGFGLVKASHPDWKDADAWAKICVIDTENASASLYVGSRHGAITVGQYNTIELDPPFAPKRYIEAIEIAQNAGIEFLIIDSLSHAWSGQGGMLDMQGAAAQRTGNSYTAWRDVTPEHNRLVDTILQSNMHICTTMRSKTEYVLEDNGKGKKVPRKIGTAPIFRDGIEYEFTTVFEVNQQHIASVSKDRTGLFDGESMLLSPKEGERLYAWLQQGVPEEPKPSIRPAVQPQTVTAVVNEEAGAPEATGTQPASTPQSDFVSYIEDVTGGKTKAYKTAVSAIIKEHNGGSNNFRAITDEAVMQEIIAAIEEAKENGTLND